MNDHTLVVIQQNVVIVNNLSPSSLKLYIYSQIRGKNAGAADHRRLCAGVSARRRQSHQCADIRVAEVLLPAARPPAAQEHAHAVHCAPFHVAQIDGAADAAVYQVRFAWYEQDPAVNDLTISVYVQSQVLEKAGVRESAGGAVHMGSGGESSHSGKGEALR